MTWTELSTNWAAHLSTLAARFPHVNLLELNGAPKAADDLTAHLARTHDLTPSEAEEELQDWMLIQGLARAGSADLRVSA